MLTTVTRESGRRPRTAAFGRRSSSLISYSLLGGDRPESRSALRPSAPCRAGRSRPSAPAAEPAIAPEYPELECSRDRAPMPLFRNFGSRERFIAARIHSVLSAGGYYTTNRRSAFLDGPPRRRA